MLKNSVCLVCVPWRLSDQHGPVELALDVCVTRSAGMDKRVDGDQDKTLSVELPDLNRKLSDGGETKHRWHRHLWREERGGGGRSIWLRNGHDRLQKRLRGNWKRGSAGTKRKKGRKKERTKGVNKQRQGMFHYDNSPWRTTHGIFTLNLKLITPELLAFVSTVTNSLFIGRQTHGGKCATAKMQFLILENALLNTFTPTQTGGGIYLKKAHTSKGWQCYHGEVLAAIANTELVLLLQNTMERNPLYFSGTWLAELSRQNPRGRAR